MEHHTEIHLLSRRLGRVARLAGVNIEAHLYGERSNLWDWLADSGFEVARQFHPELNLRKIPFDPARVQGLRTEADYQAFCKHCFSAVRQADKYPEYVFDEEVPWLGVPDQLIAKTMSIGVQSIVSVGAHPRMFPRPLIAESDGAWDWGAAACIYEYSVTLMWHYAATFGVTEFTTINEPENQLTAWYYPEKLAWLKNPPKDAWGRLFRDDQSPTGDSDLLIASLSSQYAAVARIQRQAMDDVRQALPDPAQAAKCKLHGPTNVVWKPFWEKAAPYLDSLDVHHYHPAPHAMERVFALVSEHAAHKGKPISCTEFNRRSGGSPLVDFPFNKTAAIETLLLYLHALTLGGIGRAECDLVCLYLLAFPSTHRNYKHLLYGDMNQVDWRGFDTKPWARHPAWYPTFEEMQIRHATPAYQMIRMVNRMLSPQGSRAEMMGIGLTNPGSAGPDDIHFGLKFFAFDTGNGGRIVWVINPDLENRKGVAIKWSHESLAGYELVIRGGEAVSPDHLLAYHSPVTGSEEITIPAQGVTQWILAPQKLPVLTSIEIIEITDTPGSISSGLELFQTTRLGVVGLKVSGDKIPLLDSHVIWTSSQPDLISAQSSGLIQRVRGGGGRVLITAKTADGKLSATVEIEDHTPKVIGPGPMRHLGTVGLGEV